MDVPLVYSFHEKFTQPFIMIKIPLLTLLRSTNDDIARHKSVCGILVFNEEESKS